MLLKSAAVVIFKFYKETYLYDCSFVIVVRGPAYTALRPCSGAVR